MFRQPTLEDCTDQGDPCHIEQHASGLCQDCDGLGTGGTLPCGRCAGSGMEPSSPLAAGVREGVRIDFGALWTWRSREWLLGRPLLRGIRSGPST
jgi:hypothetical protein